MEISPIAQVALLHTDMNSGFKLDPRIGMKSTKNKLTIMILSIASNHFNKECHKGNNLSRK